MQPAGEVADEGAHGNVRNETPSYIANLTCEFIFNSLIFSFTIILHRSFCIQ